MCCTYCGKQINDGAAFCQHCGKSQQPNHASAHTPNTHKNKELIALVPEHLITGLANKIEDGNDSEYVLPAEKVFASGTLTMEHHLRICDGMLNVIAKIKRRSFVERALFWLLKFLSGACLLAFIPWVLIFCIGKEWFLSLPSDGIRTAYALWPCIACAVLFIASKICDTLFDFLHRVTPNNYPTEDDVQKYIKHGYISSLSLEKICRKLNLDSNEFKIDLRKVKGGNTTVIGWGSGGMIAAGITLSAISGFATWAKNGFINQRIERVENLLFFNNVADYFNKL